MLFARLCICCILNFVLLLCLRATIWHCVYHLPIHSPHVVVFTSDNSNVLIMFLNYGAL